MLTEDRMAEALGVQWCIPWMRSLPSHGTESLVQTWRGRGRAIPICLSLYMRFCRNTALPIHPVWLLWALQWHLCSDPVVQEPGVLPAPEGEVKRWVQAGAGNSPGRASTLLGKRTSVDLASRRRDLFIPEFQGSHFGYGFPWWLSGKESPCQCRRCWFDPWVGKIPWRRKWQPTPVFLPGESHGQRSLERCSPGGHKGVGNNWGTKPPPPLLWLQNDNDEGQWVQHWNGRR